MRAICLIAAFCIGWWCHSHFDTRNVSTVNLRGQVWCLYGDYASLKDYDTTQKVPHSLVDIHGKGVTVYVPCEILYP
jgi:hypothetical protein